MGDVQDGTTIEGNADWKGESIRANISSFELLKLFQRLKLILKN